MPKESGGDGCEKIQMERKEFSLPKAPFSFIMFFLFLGYNVLPLLGFTPSELTETVLTKFSFL